MRKIDLITGFLGSGKTTFIKYYAKRLLSRGENICVLENDLGAINVDRMLLKDIEEAGCDVEMIVGGDGCCAHRRRLQTKLISLAMLGYERIIIEPSGVFDVDELFDLLHEEPLDTKYEIGNIVTIVDYNALDNLSEKSEYLLTKQLSCAGKILIGNVNVSILSNVANKEKTLSDSIRNPITTVTDCGILAERLNNTLKENKCNRIIRPDEIITKPLNGLSDNDLDDISNCGYANYDLLMPPTGNINDYDSLFSFDYVTSLKNFKEVVTAIFNDISCGNVIRIKGFMETDDMGWYTTNATKDCIYTAPCGICQNVIIVIGENLSKENICKYIPVR